MTAIITSEFMAAVTGNVRMITTMTIIRKLELESKVDGVFLP